MRTADRMSNLEYSLIFGLATRGRRAPSAALSPLFSFTYNYHIITKIELTATESGRCTATPPYEQTVKGDSFAVRGKLKSSPHFFFAKNLGGMWPRPSPPSPRSPPPSPP